MEKGADLEGPEDPLDVGQIPQQGNQNHISTDHAKRHLLGIRYFKAALRKDVCAYPDGFGSNCEGGTPGETDRIGGAGVDGGGHARWQQPCRRPGGVKKGFAKSCDLRFAIGNILNGSSSVSVGVESKGSRVGLGGCECRSKGSYVR